MKYFKGIIIIYAFYLFGSFISKLLLPYFVLPGSIIGMLFLFLGLVTGLIKDQWIEPVCKIFLKHMGFFFVPLGVSIMASYQLLDGLVLQIILYLLLSTATIMGLSAKVTDYLIRKGGKENANS